MMARIVWITSHFDDPRCTFNFGLRFSLLPLSICSFLSPFENSTFKWEDHTWVKSV